MVHKVTELVITSTRSDHRLVHRDLRRALKDELNHETGAYNTWSCCANLERVREGTDWSLRRPYFFHHRDTSLRRLIFFCSCSRP